MKSQARRKTAGPVERNLTRFLTPRQVRTCAAVWADGHSHRDTARAHGITCDASRKRSYRARLRLRSAGIDPPDARRRGRRTPTYPLNDDV